MTMLLIPFLFKTSSTTFNSNSNLNQNSRQLSTSQPLPLQERWDPSNTCFYSANKAVLVFVMDLIGKKHHVFISFDPNDLPSLENKSAHLVLIEDKLPSMSVTT